MISKDKTYRTEDGHEILDFGPWFDGHFWGKIMPNEGEERPPIFTAWLPDGTCRAYMRPEWKLIEVKDDKQG
jgi:hypothetical protein